MFWYIVRRLLQGIPVFFGSTFLIYAMVFAMPGNPILRMFGDRTPSPEQVAALEDKFNLDQPFFVRYFLYLGDVFQGNLGTTFSGQSVNDILIRTCKGRKDYTGGVNHFVALAMLDDIPALAAAVRAITGVRRDAADSADRHAA